MKTILSAGRALAPLLLACTRLAANTDCWHRTETTVTRSSGSNLVWRLVADPTQGKPYFHPLATPGGTMLTDLRPTDHPWHRGLWWSWKFINGLNYWEEAPDTGRSEGATELVSMSCTTSNDDSARIDCSLAYHPWNAPTVMTERRVLVISAPTGGQFMIEWLSEFTAITNVTLDRTPVVGKRNGMSWGGYAGLSLRMAPALRTGTTFRNSEGAHGMEALQGKPARWLSVQTTNGAAAGVVLLDHPDNPRHPVCWYLSDSMPYVSPALLFNAPLKLVAGTSLRLRYALWVHDGARTADDIEAKWRSFAASTH